MSALSVPPGPLPDPAPSGPSLVPPPTSWEDPTSATATMAAIDDLLGERLDALREEWVRESTSPDPVLAGDDVPVLLADLVRAGGKRLRPLMCHWGWVAAGGAAHSLDPTPMHAAGAALELLHAFGLAQDDVMDGSATRRGRPAVHVVASARHDEAGGRDDAARYGESIAVLVGDLAHAEADALASGLPADARRVWWRMSVELVRGQARDLSGTARAGGGDALAQALEVARLKSGAYTVQRPLELGATLASARRPVLDALAVYGRHLGTAFALRDDLLGVFGDPAVTGKPAGDDLRTGKATVLVALAERRCTGAAAQALGRLRAHLHDDDDTACIRAALETTGVRAEVEDRVTDASQEAVAALRGVDDPTAVEALTTLARDVAWRSC